MEIWVPSDEEDWSGYQMNIGGHLVQIAVTGGGNPPGKGGQQTSRSCIWWRFDHGEWRQSGARSLVETRRTLPELISTLILWGILPERTPL